MRTGVFSAILCLSAAWGAIDLTQEANAQDSRIQNTRSSLPDLAPEQIVEDVKITFDNRAGTQEYAAPTFDPFESRSDIAGSASLRTVTHAVSIDGQDLQDGAILDLAFYYNQVSDNPHADRGFGEVAFLSGSQAPAVLRDSRALECATDVQQTSFDQGFHINSGFFYPYGHYYGHSRFGHRSIGSGAFNRGFRHNGFSRSFGGRSFGGNSFSRNDFGGWRRRPSGFGRSVNRSEVRSRNRGRRRNDARDNSARTGQNFAENTEQSSAANTAANTNPKNRRRVRTQPTREGRPRPPTSQARPKQAQPAQVSPKQAQPKQARPKAARPKIQPARTQPRSKNFNFFPNDFGYNSRAYYGGRQVVTSVRTDCTREELLSVHIPAARLEAARFDGLTVLARDRQGQELPVFIPANYIEGLRLATSGQYDSRLMRFDGRPPLSSPQGQIQNQPQSSFPSRTTPNGIITSCPAGTIYQANNGTCLVDQNEPIGAYPQP